MKKLVTALFLILATVVWAGDFEDGVAASEKGDFKIAFSFYKKAAAQGEASAQYNVGLYYDIGKGVLQNDAEAARWYKLAAEQGDSSAQFNLAVIYNGVIGVSQDYAEAVRWYKLAAEQGNKSAQYNLEVMYYSSEEVLQDYLQAHMRINLIH